MTHLGDILDAALKPTPIDWTKPLEHIDGTARIMAQFQADLGYHRLVREDGEALT